MEKYKCPVCGEGLREIKNIENYHIRVADKPFEYVNSTYYICEGCTDLGNTIIITIHHCE